MPYFIEIHHAIGKPLLPALSDFKWEQLPLDPQADQGFAAVDDPAIADRVTALLTRMDVIGVRVVFQPHSPDTKAATFHDPAPGITPGPPVPPPADGQVMVGFGR